MRKNYLTLSAIAVTGLLSIPAFAQTPPSSVPAQKQCSGLTGDALDSCLKSAPGKSGDSKSRADQRTPGSSEDAASRTGTPPTRGSVGDKTDVLPKGGPGMGSQK